MSVETDFIQCHQFLDNVEREIDKATNGRVATWHDELAKFSLRLGEVSSKVERLLRMIDDSYTPEWRVL